MIKAPSFTWLLVKRTADGTLANPSGTVRSLNPNSNEPPYSPYHWEERPAGANGGYEVVAIDGGQCAYNPSGNEPVIFGWKETVPHSDGFSAITEDPL